MSLTNDQIAAASFLAIHYHAWVNAIAADEPPPTIADSLDARPAVGEALDFIAALLGTERSISGKMRVTRFLAGLADMLAEEGNDLELLMTRITRPDAPAKFAFVLDGEAGEELARRMTEGADA